MMYVKMEGKEKYNSRKQKMRHEKNEGKRERTMEYAKRKKCK